MSSLSPLMPVFVCVAFAKYSVFVFQFLFLFFFFCCLVFFFLFFFVVCV